MAKNVRPEPHPSRPRCTATRTTALHGGASTRVSSVDPRRPASTSRRSSASAELNPRARTESACLGARAHFDVGTGGTSTPTDSTRSTSSLALSILRDVTIYPYQTAQRVCRDVLALEKLQAALKYANDVPSPHVAASLRLVGLEPNAEDLGLEPGDSLEEALTSASLKRRIDEVEDELVERAKFLLRLIDRLGLADRSVEDLG